VAPFSEPPPNALPEVGVTLACQLGCPPARCERRATLAAGGWACTWLNRLGVLDAAAPAPPAEERVRVAGWSRGAVIQCPDCGCRAYSAGPAGLPERRCRECGCVWNPEADVRPPLASLVGRAAAAARRAS